MKKAERQFDSVLKKGEYQKAINTAIQMKKDKMPVNLIIKYTGLTKEEIDKL